MTFNVGEKVVYPNHGIGTIENISTRSFGAADERFYLLRLNYNSMTVMVPFSHVADVGLRKITKAGEITRVLNFLAIGDMQIQRRLESPIQSEFGQDAKRQPAGNLGSIQVSSDYSSGKPLSFREKKMLDRARHMLVTEVSICRAVGEAGAIDLLQKALGKASLQLARCAVVRTSKKLSKNEPKAPFFMFTVPWPLF